MLNCHQVLFNSDSVLKLLLKVLISLGSWKNFWVISSYIEPVSHLENTSKEVCWTRPAWRGAEDMGQCQCPQYVCWKTHKGWFSTNLKQAKPTSGPWSIYTFKCSSWCSPLYFIYINCRDFCCYFNYNLFVSLWKFSFLTG